MLQELLKYLKLLRVKASILERTSINGDVDNTFKAKYATKLGFSAVALISIFFLKTGFSEGFVSYISSVLSILVGLFITALIFSFDKFYSRRNLENANSRTKTWDTQAYNYVKKFAYVTGRTIVLCVFILILLAFSAQFKEVASLDVWCLTFNFKEVKWNSIGLLVYAFIVILQRFFVVFWLQKIIFNTLFIVSSMVEFMIIKIDRNTENDTN